MWVLSTSRAELHFFPSPEDVSDGYAALSHVWDKEEQSFQDVRRIQERCANAGTNPRDFMGEKIRRCCELAERHGYRWVWIDTCCIDKTSSAELSEAINSMFRYYALACVCYGYLRDVPFFQTWPHRRLEGNERTFARSIWFQRGWTLQELIAPHFFLFLSCSWEVLGTKADLAELVQDAHDVPAPVLRLEVRHTDFSISQRMAWFRRRNTTRVEDEAYCLLGLFDIHMPPLYGEGRNAFRRLQEEIMRRSTDTTLFAWEGTGETRAACTCLFASSPTAFAFQHEGKIEYTPPQYADRQDRHTLRDPVLRSELRREVAAGATVNDITFSLTPYGVLASLPIIQVRVPIAENTAGLSEWDPLRNEEWRQYIPYTPSGVAVYADLYWSIHSEQGTTFRGLLRLEDDLDTRAPSSRYPSYHIMVRDNHRGFLWVPPPTTSGEYTMHGQTASASWQEVLIRYRLPPHRLVPGQLPDAGRDFVPAIPVQATFDAPFRFDKAHIDRFMRQSETARVKIYSPADPALVRYNLTTYVFFHQYGYNRDIIKVGQCHYQHQQQDQNKPQTAEANLTGAGVPRNVDSGGPPLPIWATVIALRKRADEEETVKIADSPTHDCGKDHVSRWPGLRKAFRLLTVTRSDPARTIRPAEWLPVVTLSFTPCPINPARTLVLDAAYDNVEEQAKDEEVEHDELAPGEEQDSEGGSTGSEYVNLSRTQMRPSWAISARLTSGYITENASGW